MASRRRTPMSIKFIPKHKTVTRGDPLCSASKAIGLFDGKEHTSYYLAEGRIEKDLRTCVWTRNIDSALKFNHQNELPDEVLRLLLGLDGKGSSKIRTINLTPTKSSVDTTYKYYML